MLSIINLHFFQKNGMIILQLFFQSYSEFRCIFLQIELWIRFFNFLYEKFKQLCGFIGSLVE